MSIGNLHSPHSRAPTTRSLQISHEFSRRFSAFKGSKPSTVSPIQINDNSSSEGSEATWQTGSIPSLMGSNDFVSITRRGGHGFHELLPVENLQNETDDTSQSVDGNLASSLIIPASTEKRICKFCRQTSNDPEAARYLKCNACDIIIHESCIEISDCKPCCKSFKEKKIQQAFFKVFTSMLRNYRSYLVMPDANIVQDKDFFPEEWFRKADFLLSLDRESRAFMSQFMETHAFSQFAIDRLERDESDFEILFFDESLKAKRNRSKFRLAKEETPFLEDPSYNISQTFHCIEPNLTDLEPDFVYSKGLFPIELNSDYLLDPKPLKALTTRSDQKIMKSRTTELVRRARNASAMVRKYLNNCKKRKQEFGKWMKTKWKHFQKIGNGEVVSIGFLSDEQRIEMFAARVKEVSDVIDCYEAAYLSTLSQIDVKKAIDDLHSQNLVLMHATDEEQLVDSTEQEDLQKIYYRLFTVITIYEDYLATLRESVAHKVPLQDGEVVDHQESMSETVQKDIIE